ncbi:MAG: HD domain-containing protein [bacterium]|nr:HD domain-containing protein [bacterium]
MDKKNIRYLRKWFKNYVKGFLGEDSYTNDNIVLKEGHTYRVCGHCKSIARFLDMPPEKSYLAEAAGLLHDIGRFEQFKKYRTFNDALSENHGELGEKVLLRENILSPLAQTQQAVILTAVRCHGLKELPVEENDETLFFLKILRDADKLDILKVLSDYYTSKESGSNPALDLELPETPEISRAVVRDVLAGRCVDLTHVETANDFKLLQVSWVFDLNFSYSRQYIKEHGYMERIMEVLPPTSEIQQVKEHINDFLDKN